MKKVLILLMLVSFSIWGRFDNSLIENRIDHEPNQEDIQKFLKRKSDEKQVLIDEDKKK